VASPDIHYDEGACPHSRCSHPLEWIDFRLELHGDPEGIYEPLHRSWGEGTGFVGRCPTCGGWIRFTPDAMQAIDDEGANLAPKMPDNWAQVAQFSRGD